MSRIAKKAPQGRTQNYILALTLLIALRSAAQESAAQASTVQGPKSIALAPSRTVVVSIPDRQLAVLEGGNVIATFPVAVGAAHSPSPTGTFQIVSRVANPT